MHEVGMPLALWDAQRPELCRERNDARSRLVVLAGSPRKRACGRALDVIEGSSESPLGWAASRVMERGRRLPLACASVPVRQKMAPGLHHGG
jgi:hypothetical protein